MEGSTGSRLTYEVYLKSFERAKESWQLDGEQKVEQARILKDKGTIFFKVNIVISFHTLGEQFCLPTPPYTKRVPCLYYSIVTTGRKI